MKRPGMRRPLLALLFLWTPPLHAYDQKIHVWLSKRAYGGAAQVAGSPADGDVVKALREQVWHAGAENADTELKRRFLARYPDLARFDAWEWKRFLGLNPDKHVAGLDETPLPTGDDAREVYAAASRLPDDDWRNRVRFRHDDQRRVMTDPWGKPLPEDPATLEMGALDGLSSQAHAHYGLPRIAFSDDPEVLKKDPRRFAIPPTVHTFGAEYAETYTQLAVLAANLPGGSRLALTFSGAAAHHIQDVANQIHTVQVGVYDFFVDAKLESIKEDLRTLGGLVRARPTFVSIGIGIIANHHTLLEALFAKHLLAAGDPVGALAEKAPGDDALAANLEKLAGGCEPGFGRAVAEQLIDRSSYEGAPVYAAIRAVAVRSLSRVGHHFEDGDDPDAFVKPGADLSHFYDLEVRGARRADQTSTAWWKRFTACQSVGGAVTRTFTDALLRNRLDALEAADARFKQFTPKAPVKAEIAWWVPALYVVLILAGYGLIRTLRRRRAS
jgi:hypothetical protein